MPLDIAKCESDEHAGLKRHVRWMLGPSTRFEFRVGGTKFDVVSAERRLAVECQVSAMSGDEFYERCNDAEDAGLELWWVLGRQHYGHVEFVGQGSFLRVKDLEYSILCHQGVLLYLPWCRVPMLRAIRLGDKKWRHGNQPGGCETLRFITRSWLSVLPVGAGLTACVQEWRRELLTEDRRER